LNPDILKTFKYLSYRCERRRNGTTICTSNTRLMYGSRDTKSSGFTIKNRTRDICLEAVKQNGSVLPIVPEKYKQDLSMAAVTRDGLALQYVKQQTPDLCMAAINQNARALRYVEDPTIDLCLAAVTKEGWVLGFVHNRLRTLEVCMAAVNQNNTVLDEVPANIRGRVRASFRNRGNSTNTSGNFKNLPDVSNADPRKLG